MKKFLAILLAATVLAAPMAQARDNHRGPDRHRHVEVQKNYAPQKKVTQNKRHWNKGYKLSSSQRRHVVDQRDYRRYKLAKPRHDQRWVKVDNQFLLINFATGLIVGLAAAR